jgi:hypothetical protein
MSKGNTTENDVLKYIFNSTAMPNYGTSLYLSLHTGDPGEAGDQTSSETTYTGYNRKAVSRDAGGFLTAVAGLTQNQALIQFDQCSGNPQTITHIAVGTALSGAGQILYSGILNAPLAVANLIQPQIPANALIIQED